MDALVLNTFKITAIVAGVFLLLLGLWVYADFFLLLFGGVLWGVGLSGVARFGGRYARLPYLGALTLSLLLLGGALALVGWRMGPKIAAGLLELQDMLPEILQQLRSQVHHIGLLQELLTRLSSADNSLVGAQAFSRIAGVFSTTVGIVTASLFILVIGIYVALKPEVYREGITRLVVPAKRDYAREVLAEIAHTLRWWLLGRLLALTLVGVLTWIGLFALGIESAITLAFVAAVLSFIPNVGPVLSVIPAVLVGWSVGPAMALWVVLLYAAIQAVESYLITPMVQQRNLAIPPALLLSAQFLLGLMFGIMGLLLATPLLVVALVLVRMLYIRNVLKDEIQLP